MSEYRPELPELTERIARLPVYRGYPVPWFVAWLDEEGHPTPRGLGTPDFRVLFPEAPLTAHRHSLCWICGGTLGAFRAFVVGPMCVVVRTSAEPPMHVDCAEWSVRGCPFLTRPNMRRREAGVPKDAVDPPGIMLRPNPGMVVVWVVKKYKLRNVPGYAGETLFDISDPVEVRYYAEGRDATREEIEASIETGLPTLRDLAEQQGPIAVGQLERLVEKARDLLPA